MDNIFSDVRETVPKFRANHDQKIKIFSYQTSHVEIQPGQDRNTSDINYIHYNSKAWRKNISLPTRNRHQQKPAVAQTDLMHATLNCKRHLAPYIYNYKI